VAGKKKGGVSDERKRERERGRTADEFGLVIEKHSGAKERQKRDEHEKNWKFDPTQPNKRFSQLTSSSIKNTTSTCNIR